MGFHHSKLPPEQLSELMNSTHFNKRELRRMYNDFIKRNPSGQLNKSEFGRMFKQSFRFGDPGEFADYVFNIFDTDRSGSIDFKELICALSVTDRGSLDERLKWTFELYDSNHDGYITYAEMLHIVQSRYKMIGRTVKRPPDEDTPEKAVDKMFRNMDKDKNAKLTYDEFVEGSKQDPTILQPLPLYDYLIGS